MEVEELEIRLEGVKLGWRELELEGIGVGVGVGRELELELGGSWRGVKMGLFCLLAQ